MRKEKKLFSRKRKIEKNIQEWLLFVFGFVSDVFGGGLMDGWTDGPSIKTKK